MTKKSIWWISQQKQQNKIFLAFPTRPHKSKQSVTTLSTCIVAATLMFMWEQAFINISK